MELEIRRVAKGIKKSKIPVNFMDRLDKITKTIVTTKTILAKAAQDSWKPINLYTCSN